MITEKESRDLFEKLNDEIVTQKNEIESQI